MCFTVLYSFSFTTVHILEVFLKNLLHSQTVRWSTVLLKTWIEYLHMKHIRLQIYFRNSNFEFVIFVIFYAIMSWSKWANIILSEPSREEIYATIGSTG